MLPCIFFVSNWQAPTHVSAEQRIKQNVIFLDILLIFWQDLITVQNTHNAKQLGNRFSITTYEQCCDEWGGAENRERSEAGGVIGNERHLRHSPVSSPTEELRKG